MSDGRLEIALEILPGVEPGRVPMRTIALRFRNRTTEPLRIYLPQAEAFRANISTIFMAPESGAPLGIPEPHPHGYVVTEDDFPLIAPGATYEARQTFTLDPIQRGGQGTARRPGFEAGRTVRVRWIYSNSIRRWPGGTPTFDGPTKTLFGGQDIPHIWTGELTLMTRWTVPP